MGVELAKDLKALLGDEVVLEDPADLVCYSYDASFAAQQGDYRPEVVVLPRSRDDVARTVEYAAAKGIPITPRGAATGLAGGCVPVSGGIVIDLSRLNRIVELDRENLQVIIEPGVVHANLNDFLREHGLFFPPDPGSSKMCTVGGMVANNSRGMRALKYGSTGDYVLGLEVVLPDGEVITTGSANSRALQSSSGLELTKVFVGSEGTLGIMTLIRLKILPLPQARGVLIAFFDRLEDSGLAVMSVLGAGILPSAIEILDASAIKAVNLYSPSLALPEAEAMLLFEVDGNRPGVIYDLERIREAIARLAIRFREATEPKDIAALWEARAVVGAAASQAITNGYRVYAGEDIAVPLSKVPEALSRVREIGRANGVTIVTYGHISSGGLHPAIVVDLMKPDEVAKVAKVADAIHHLALELGGTVTGEHGVGMARAEYMPLEHGRALDVMRAIKKALDPQGIMNPGKMFLDQGRAS